MSLIRSKERVAELGEVVSSEELAARLRAVSDPSLRV
jgi:hypothetical protein